MKNKVKAQQGNAGLAPIRRTQRCDGGPRGHEVPVHVKLEPLFMCGPGGAIEVYCPRHAFGNGRLRRVREKVVRRRGLSYWLLWCHRWLNGCTAPAEWHTKGADCLAGRGLSIVEND